MLSRSNLLSCNLFLCGIKYLPMERVYRSKYAIIVLKMAVFTIFLGRSWQHLFWDAPYRTILWDEVLLQPVIEGIFGISWNDYVISPVTDMVIQRIIFFTGVLYLLAAVATLLYEKVQNGFLKYVILFGGCNLVLLSILLTKEKFYHFAMFFEHSIQFGLPFVFVHYVKDGWVFKNIAIVLKVMVAIVFVSHGLYAVGYYPVPGEFVDMVVGILGASESQAKVFLHAAALLDFMVAILIFVPKASVYALWYAFVWGILTALARVMADYQFDFPLQSLHQDLYRTVYRLAHGLVPLAILLLNRR